jgi:hypothetical protein
MSRYKQDTGDALGAAASAGSAYMAVYKVHSSVNQH